MGIDLVPPPVPVWRRVAGGGLRGVWRMACDLWRVGCTVWHVRCGCVGGCVWRVVGSALDLPFLGGD